MRQAVAKGIALEFGKLPQLWAFSEPGEARPASNRCALFVVYSEKVDGGKTRTLLRACQSLQSIVWKHAHSPEWLILVDEDRRVSSLAREMFQAPLSSTRPLDLVVFYCAKSLDRWTVDEKSKFQYELDSAIDFLSQLAPAEVSDQDPPSDPDGQRRLQLACERRDQLLREEKWIDAPAVHGQQGGKPDSSRHQQHREPPTSPWGTAGAWNGREFLHPTFRFHPGTGRLMPEMKTLLDILPKDRSGWRQTLWVFQRHG